MSLHLLDIGFSRFIRSGRLSFVIAISRIGKVLIPEYSTYHWIYSSQHTSDTICNLAYLCMSMQEREGADAYTLDIRLYIDILMWQRASVPGIRELAGLQMESVVHYSYVAVTFSLTCFLLAASTFSSVLALASFCPLHGLTTTSVSLRTALSLHVHYYLSFHLQCTPSSLCLFSDSCHMWTAVHFRPSVYVMEKTLHTE